MRRLAECIYTHLRIDTPLRDIGKLHRSPSNPFFGGLLDADQRRSAAGPDDGKLLPLFMPWEESLPCSASPSEKCYLTEPMERISSGPRCAQTLAASASRCSLPHRPPATTALDISSRGSPQAFSLAVSGRVWPSLRAMTTVARRMRTGVLCTTCSCRSCGRRVPGLCALHFTAAEQRCRQLCLTLIRVFVPPAGGQHHQPCLLRRPDGPGLELAGRPGGL